VVDCDFVIAAIGQGTKVQELVDGHVPNFLPFGEVLNLTRWQTIQVNDKTFETSVEGVFSGGDVVTGAATAVEAIAAGRKAAHAIDTYIRTGKAQPEPFEFVSRKDTFRKVTLEDLRDGARYARSPMPSLPAEERVKGFVEVEQGYTAEQMKLESLRCLECGCVSLFNCDLRRYATEYQVDISQFTGEAKEHRIDRSHPLIELDPNKCILCGRCVRICSDVVGVAAYGFINRGFNTVVRPALGGSLLDTDCVSCGLCIGTCPTGAIVDRIALAKPGPWATTQTPTVCHYCGVGCGLMVDTFGDALVKMSRNDDAKVTLSNHCKRGRFGYDYVQAPERLVRGMIRAGRELQSAPLEETIEYTGMRLKELTRRYSGSEIAVLVSPRMTNEEIYLAQKLARVACKTHNVTTLAHLVNRELDCPEVLSTATYAEVADAQAILVVNSNTEEENFVADLLVKRAIRTGGKLIFVGPEENRLSWLAEVRLVCKEGAQADVVRALQTGGAAEGAGVAAADLEAARKVLEGSILKVMVFNKDYRGARKAGDERVFAEAAEALGCSILALREKSNMQGLLDMGASPVWLPGYIGHEDEAAVDELEKDWCVVLRDLERSGEEIADLLRKKKIRVAIVLGEDPVGNEAFPRDLCEGLAAADFLVVGDLFMTATAALANVVLPLSSSTETSGTMTNSERRVARLARAVPPAAGSETWQILCDIAGRMGYRFKMKYSSVAEVTDEICHVVPIYRGVAIGSADPDGVWDLGAFGRERRAPEGGSRIVQPIPTLHLDPLEARFLRRFDEIFEAARSAHEGTQAFPV
jgi:formate dehydrogenase major subunit